MGKISLLVAALAATSQAIDIPAVPTWPAGRCTDKSLSIPSWTISGYKQSQGTVTFQVENRANGVKTAVECSSTSCTSNNPKLSASVAVGTSGPIVTIRDAWTCTDAEER